MAGDIVPFEVPAALAEKYKGIFGDTNKDLSEGVQPSFGVVSFKGKVWRVKFKGEERIVRNKDGDPAASLVAVIVKASPQISKIYYPGAYTEGDNDAPLCYSIDGVKPDPNSKEIQAPNCAVCPRNVWGSKITEQGNKTKACADSRRLAIVPYPDLRNANFGGPLLLRVPPASLQELARFSDELEELGVPYQAVITKITFDAELAYPKLVFSAIKALTEEEALVIKELLEGPEIGRMLAEAPITDEAMTPAQAAHQPAQAAGPAPAAAEAPKTETAAPAPAQPVADDIPATSLGEAPAAASEPEPEKKAEKPSAKEANAVEAETVDEQLGSLIGGLL